MNLREWARKLKRETLALYLAIRLIPPGLMAECRAEREALSATPTSWVGAAVIASPPLSGRGFTGCGDSA